MTVIGFLRTSEWFFLVRIGLEVLFLVSDRVEPLEHLLVARESMARTCIPLLRHIVI
jgi:hypothetical protein